MAVTDRSVGSLSPSSPESSTNLRSSAIDRLLLGLVAVLVIAVPTVFYRRTFSVFDVPQLTLLWLLATAVAIVECCRFLVTGQILQRQRTLSFLSSGFLAALILSSVLSDQPWVAFTGLSARGAGAITYGLCLGLLLVVTRLGQRQPLRLLLLAFVVGHAVVVLYALIQAYGLDPYNWGVGDVYVGPVFSTLGNPNFSAGYVGLTLPIVVWTTFDSRLPISLSIPAGASIGASTVALAHFNSFQGGAAALLALGVLGLWAGPSRKYGRSVAVGIVLPVAVVIAVVPVLLESPTGWTMSGLIALTASCAGLGRWWDRRTGGQERGAGEVVNSSTIGSAVAAKRYRWAWTASLVPALLAGFFLFGSRIVGELESGLRHRSEFWRVGLSLFSESPIVGMGLETYQEFFTSYRSVDHAVNWETVLSDSPHSVPIGILSGGGLFLALAYAALMAVILWSGIRAVRHSSGPDVLFYGAALTAWIAYHVQSLVSIDMPGLIHVQWILGGVLLAGGFDKGEFGHRRSRSWQGRWLAAIFSSKHRLWRVTGVVLLCAASLVLLVGPLTAPFRADLAAYKAQRALSLTDYQTAGDELLRAIDLQPRNAPYAEGMALVYSESGLFNLAFEERARSARLRPGNPYLALLAAEAAVGLNRYDDADQWIRRAVANEPYGSKVLADASSLWIEIGRPEQAIQALDSFEVLRSPNTDAWQTARESYLALGENDKAEHARLCSSGGQVGCVLPNDLP